MPNRKPPVPPGWPAQSQENDLSMEEALTHINAIFTELNENISEINAELQSAATDRKVFADQLTATSGKVEALEERVAIIGQQVTDNSGLIKGQSSEIHAMHGETKELRVEVDKLRPVGVIFGQVRVGYRGAKWIGGMIAALITFAVGIISIVEFFRR